MSLSVPEGEVGSEIQQDPHTGRAPQDHCQVSSRLPILGRGGERKGRGGEGRGGEGRENNTASS